MKKQICFLVLFLTLAAPCQEQMRLAVLEPEGKGLSKDEVWMLSLVQSTIAADFNKYSSITIIDRQNLEAIIAEQKRSLSAITSDEDAIRIGNLANASHILTGKITKTPKTFMLELAITDAETGKRQASYSPKGVTPSQVEDLSALKAASADLLKQLGVSLTDSQLAELRGSATATQVQAQTALARGVVAERQGTSVAALSYYYQAAAFDPTLVEAVKRSSIMSANISGINIGENIRNDIVWRKKWVEQLKETEETFYKIINSADPPYTLYYSTAIETKNINYQKETADLSIALNLLANMKWFNAMQEALKAAKAVDDGLEATSRRYDWGLSKWPVQGVSSTNPFAPGNNWTSSKPKKYDISVEFELVNQQGRMIGRQTAKLDPSFSFDNYNKFIVDFKANQFSILTFNAVNANDISDNLTIRVASVNGAPPKTARFPIIAISFKKLPEYLTDSRDGKKYGAIEIGHQTWMAENLNFNAEGSKCNGEGGKVVNYLTKITLSDAEIQANCAKYGRLYDWNSAKKVCPEGWHLPSKDEWESLENFAGGYKVAGKKLKTKSGWSDVVDNWNKSKSDNNGEDTYGFSALPGASGYYDNSYKEYRYGNVGESGYWWTMSFRETNFIWPYYYKIHDNNGETPYSDDSRYLHSVRCVKDD